MSIMICHRCDDEVDTDLHHGEYDGGLDKWFCDTACQLEFYLEEHDRLVKKNNNLSAQYSDAMMQLRKAEIELKTVYDSARQGLLACGIGVVL